MGRGKRKDGRSMSVGKALNRPFNVTLAGKSYKIARITLDDLGDFEEWVRECRIRTARKALPVEGETRAETEQLQAERGKMLHDLLCASSDQLHVHDEMKSMRGVAHLLYIALSRHQEVTEQEVSELLTTDNFTEIANLMGELMRTGEPMIEDEEAGPDDGPPNAAGPTPPIMIGG